MSASLGAPSRLPASERTSPGTRCADARIAQVLGPWELTARLHRGQRHDLYRARPATDRWGSGCYAIKVCRPEGDARLSLAMLRRERLVADEVEHPHLTPILGAQLSQPPHYLALPLLEGLTLDRLRGAAPRQRLTTSGALWIARQTAEALAALHAAGWLHGQVRPQHVVVSPAGHATLIDLALARRIGTDECRVVDLPQLPWYAAPESFTLGRSVTAASDVYCLGLVLFELLAGRHPFPGPHGPALAAQHRQSAPTDLQTLRPELPREAALVVGQMLAKEPLRRPDASQIVRWLAELEIALLGH